MVAMTWGRKTLLREVLLAVAFIAGLLASPGFAQQPLLPPAKAGFPFTWNGGGASRGSQPAVGFLGFDGDLDTCITIRTVACKDGRIHVQAGAGIVADSVPRSEWQETQNKARAVLRAAEMAQGGLNALRPKS